MHIISKKKLKEFWLRHPASEHPLEAWFKIVRLSHYHAWAELKAAFPAVDKVNDKIIFNIGGNKYRLIAVIHFHRGKVYIRDVLTHEKYSEEKWKND